MKKQYIILGGYLTMMLVLLITTVVQSINLKKANDKISILENKKVVTTTTTQPNLTPSSMSFTTNSWVFDDSKSACDKTIPITINIPVRDSSMCKTNSA